MGGGGEVGIEKSLFKPSKRNNTFLSESGEGGIIKQLVDIRIQHQIRYTRSQERCAKTVLGCSHSRLTDTHSKPSTTGTPVAHLSALRTRYNPPSKITK